MRNPRHCADAWNHPRLRGEYADMTCTMGDGTGSPPLARGIPLFSPVGLRMPGITPACAGNTHFCPCDSAPRRDHPRLRGEYHLYSILAIHCPGSPPLTRGILLVQSIHGTHAGITPAYAGNTGNEANFCKGYKDHPRLRGEYVGFPICMCGAMGSPPLTRGIPHYLLTFTPW